VTTEELIDLWFDHAETTADDFLAERNWDARERIVSRPESSRCHTVRGDPREECRERVSPTDRV
jgi:hypothetical protein